MSLDNAKNFGKVTVSTGYTSGATSIVLTAGGGALLPTAPFNMTWWNSSDYPDPSDDPNVEIVRVTAIVTDTLTVTRAQEGTAATSKNTPSRAYKMIATLTAKVINTDVWGSPVFTGPYAAAAQPQSCAYNSVAQSIPNGAYTPLTFNTNVFDVGPIHSTSIAQTRFTVPPGQGGTYLITGVCGFATNGTGQRGGGIDLNGSGGPVFLASFFLASTTGGTYIPFTVIAKLNAGDYIEFLVYQSSGGALNTAGGQGGVQGSMIKLC